ncbi:MAG TPA: bifunctional diguanylate cyclase/phosphodiesterase, partial [Actinomycetales bacterium]
IVYAHQLASGSYRIGSVLDSLWMVGLGLIAVGATTPSRPRADGVPPVRSLAVATLSSVAAVAVLVVAPDGGVDPLSSALALGTLAVAGLRLALAFLQLRELAVVRHQALTDELTGSGNRRALYRRLDDLLGEPGEPGDLVAAPAGFSLALVDLDHFKEVNDSFGHATGDEVLQRVALRFASTLAELGIPHLLTRLGADEFAVILEGVASPDAALGCGLALQESLVAPLTLEHVTLHVRASIGIALAPEHARSRSDMLFAADSAMYAGRTSGEPVSLFSPTLAGDRRNRLEVAEDLYAALERDELFVEYQPLVSTTGGIVGAEALVRWRHPVRGRLMPDEFLPVAERYRLTPEIAQRVLDLALTDVRRWRLDQPDLGVSVNVSATDLHNERLVHLVAAALLRHGVPPSSLTIEITESALMRDPEVAQAALQALDALGVRLAVDDYGTGYSSLEYLLKLPINEIKLDRAFSMDLARERRSVAIVRSTIDLTHALGLHMVAEGVEDAETLAILRDLDCDLVQGWHLGRPTSSADFLRLVVASSTRLRA